jgi:hypothetical protein
MSDQLHVPPTALPHYRLDRKVRGPHNQSGRRGWEKILPLPGLELRPLSHPTRTQFLYRVRYHTLIGKDYENTKKEYTTEKTI